MDISPQQIRTAEFSTVRKGLDPDEVRDFLERVATELERAQNQSTAMEARARAAVARLQELSDGAAAQAPTPEPVAVAEPEPAPAVQEIAAAPDEAETISRTLLLAQRTADTTVAEAEAEATRLRTEAETAATSTVDAAREASARLVEEAREDARRSGETERQAVESEVNALKARREFLVSDVEHLELFLADERSRLREAATAIVDLTERVPGGLGEVRRPLLSASDDDTPDGGIDEPTQLIESVEPVLPADDDTVDGEPTGPDAPELPAQDDLFVQTDIADDPPVAGGH